MIVSLSKVLTVRGSSGILLVEQCCVIAMPAIKSGECMYGPTNTYQVATPVGEVVLESCPQGLHGLNYAEELRDDSFHPDPSIQVSIITQRYQDNGYVYKPVTQCVAWLQAYFGRQMKSDKAPPNPPICSRVAKEDTFIKRAWFTLQQEVTFGQTISYKSLAEKCGNVRACRAVGQAMSRNPVSLVIPCHRVIQQGGSLGNYSQGTRNRIKRWLLQHEGVLST